MKKLLALISVISLLIIWACTDLDHSNPFDPGSGSVTGLNNVELEILKIDQIKVIWDSDYFNVPGYTFQIDRKIGEHGVWQEKYKVFQKDVYFFTDSLAGIGQLNTYRVRVGYDQNLSEGVEEAVFNNFPSPTGVSLNRKDLNTIELRWSDNSNGEDGFIIDRYAGATWNDSLAFIDENTESWTDSTVALNDSIKYRIWAYRKVTRSAAPESQWVDTTIPSPSNFTAQSLDLESVKISWTDNSVGEQGFKVDRKVGGGAWVSYYTATADSTEWIDHNAVINETMQYRIYAYKGTDNSDIIVSNILVNTFPAPTNLILNQMDLNTIRLDWKDNSDGEDGFVIDRKNSSGVWVNNVQLISGNTETWTDTPVVINDSLAYRVRGYKDTYYSDYSTATMSDITFPPPSNLAYQKMSLTSIKFTWTDNSVGEDSFIIDKKVGANEWTVSYATTAANATEWTDNSAQVNTNIQYRIYGKAGSNYSNYAVSEVIDNTIPAPTNLTYNKLDINSIRLNWSDNSTGETGFVIDRSVNGTWTNSFATAGSNATLWTDDNAVINADLVYRIKAYYTTSYSNTVETGIISNTFPAPSNLTAQVTGMDITLNWTDNSTGEAGFKIDRKYDGGLWQDTYAYVASNIITWNETVTDTGKYYYRVKAYNGADLSATSAVAEAWAKQTENEMILVPADTFQMGQVGVAEPVHEVTITHSYYLAKYETTQKEWTDIMGSNPASGYGVGDNYPVYYVSWYDILVYCNKRSMEEGLNPCYVINNSTNPNDWGSVPTAQNATWDAVECRWYENGYRLPTEAEWEYAARYNDSRNYPWGNTEPTINHCNYNSNVGATTEVGIYSIGISNLKFYDIAGNVREWIWDWNESYSDTSLTDPIGTSTGTTRVLRGGGWNSGTIDYLKNANRGGSQPYSTNYSGGFRVAKNNPADPWPPYGMVEISAGSFEMGSEIGSNNEKPIHTVNITRSYYLGKNEVTQKEWKQYMPSATYDYGTGDSYPVYYVSWYSTIVYCNKRSLAEGLEPCYSINGSTNPTDWGNIPPPPPTAYSDPTWDAAICNFNAKGYRLPTEAEWEFAAKGGHSNWIFPNGNTVSHSTNGDQQANYRSRWEVGSPLYYYDVSPTEGYHPDFGENTSPVGTFPLNDYGLSDMCGNICEWCWDFDGDNYYTECYEQGTITNPTGPISNELKTRIHRGGYYAQEAVCCRLSYRNWEWASANYRHIGFRVARTK